MKQSLSFLLLVIFIFSCAPTRKLKYTKNEGAMEDKNEFYNDRSEKTIQPYDILYIKIYSLNERTMNVFSEGSEMRNEELISYEVDDRGYINFPFIGNIYVKDMTIAEAKKRIEEELNKSVDQVSVRLRFVGNKITVLGEVHSPGSFSFYDEKITVFEAISLARGIGDFGDKTKVTLIRETDNRIKYYYLDLSSKDIVASDNYYLSPNDVLIVNPVRAKYRRMQDFTYLYVLFSSISALGTVVALAQKVK
jgi:polysaccharide biosynthesis/export protein